MAISDTEKTTKEGGGGGGGGGEGGRKSMRFWRREKNSGSVSDLSALQTDARMMATEVCIYIYI